MSDRLLLESDVVKAVDRHMKDYYQTDDGINCVYDNEIHNILEEINSAWIKCKPGHMPEDDERFKGKKIINVLVTTGRGCVTKVQRIHYIDFFTKEGYWYWGRINYEMRAWMPLPEPYKE